MRNYNQVFNHFEEYCEKQNIPNPFRYIQFDELVELNSLLDKVILFVTNADRDILEDIEADDIVKLSRLVENLYDKDL